MFDVIIIGPLGDALQAFRPILLGVIDPPAPVRAPTGGKLSDHDLAAALLGGLQHSSVEAFDRFRPDLRSHECLMESPLLRFCPALLLERLTCCRTLALLFHLVELRRGDDCYGLARACGFAFFRVDHCLRSSSVQRPLFVPRAGAKGTRVPEASWRNPNKVSISWPRFWTSL